MVLLMFSDNIFIFIICQLNGLLVHQQSELVLGNFLNE